MYVAIKIAATKATTTKPTTTTKIKSFCCTSLLAAGCASTLSTVSPSMADK